MPNNAFPQNTKFKLNQGSIQSILPQPVNILTRRNIFSAFIISISFHLVVLSTALLFHPSCTHIASMQFSVFFLSDTMLWIFSLIPLLAVIRREIQWHDPYFILSGFIFTSIMMIYLGYVIDPEYTHTRYHWGTFSFRNLSAKLLLLRFAESEFVILIFVLSLLYVNRHTPSQSVQLLVRHSHLTSAVLAGIFCAILGVIGFIVQWSPADFLDTLVFRMGSPELAAAPGTGKYVAFQKWAIMTAPLIVIGIICIAPRQRFFRLLRDLLLIFVIVTSLVPITVYGARGTVIYMIYAALVIINRFAIKLRWLHGFYAMVLIFLLVFFITMARTNPTLTDTAHKTLKSLLREGFTAIRDPKIQPSSYLFQIDRVGNVASILQHLHTTGEYQYGKSILSGPGNIIIYFINKISNLNLDQIPTSTDHAFIWTHGSIELEYFYGKRPPSLPGEFLMQFGYAGLLPFSILFAMFFYWIRKNQITSKSLMTYWLWTMITVELLNSVSAEFGVIFKFFIFHIIPILTLYGAIQFFLYGWRRKKIGKPKIGFN